MHPNELKANLTGVLAFPVTPFTDDLALDDEALRQNAHYLVEHGLNALIACGGTGEFYSLTEAECRHVATTVIRTANGRVPVVVGVGCSLQAARELAVYAQAEGADGILVLPPYYIRPDEEGLFQYYRNIAAAVDLGVIIYTRDWAAFSPDFVERLAEIPNVIALKEGQGDLRTFTKMQDRVGERLAWIGGLGDDLAHNYISSGAQAYTSSIANFIPGTAIELYQASCRSDTATVRKLMNTIINPIYSLRSKRKGYEVTLTKEGMNLLGMNGGTVRPPLPKATTEDIAALAEVLRKVS
jgi:5-dehydro-4-deoxyglucarate dehydratase